MKYVIYARKSTESEDRQALSIQSQIIEMKEIAKREHLQIVDVLEESKTAKKPGRPIFNEMIKKLEKGTYEGILCWKIDRLARNPVDEGIVKWHLQNGTIKQIKTFDRDYNPEDNIVIASIEFSMANQYIRDLSKNVKRGQAEKIRRGELPATPPLGYNMDYKTKKIFIDEEKYPYIKDAFRLYATGNYSLPSLTEKLYKDGFRSRGNKKVYGGAIYKILKNPIYYGYFRWVGQIHRGIHAPIISKKMFDAVQKILESKRHVVGRNILDFPFRGNLVCGECGLKITAEIRRKKSGKEYTYYHCTKSKGADKCSQKYVRDDVLIKEIDAHLAKLKIDEEIVDLMIGSSKENSRKEWEEARDIERKNQMLLDSNKARQESLLEKYIDNAIPQDIYNRKMAELRNEEATLEDDLRNSKENFKNVYDRIEQTIIFINSAKKIFSKGDIDIKKEVVSILASNLIIKDQKVLEIKLNEPFEGIFNSIRVSKSLNSKSGGLRTLDFGSMKTKTPALSADVFSVHGR